MILEKELIRPSRIWKNVAQFSSDETSAFTRLDASKIISSTQESRSAFSLKNMNGGFPSAQGSSLVSSMRQHQIGVFNLIQQVQQATGPVGNPFFAQGGYNMPLLTYHPFYDLQQTLALRQLNTAVSDSSLLGPMVVTTNGLLDSEAHSISKSKSSSVKKYKCDECDKAFSRSNTLATHKRIHTGEKPFKCDSCGRTFRQPGNLTRHRLTHTTVKPYVCPTCNKAFNRASNLHTHMKTHASNNFYSCHICAQTFDKKIDLKLHFYNHTAPASFSM